MRLIDADELVEKAYWHGEHPSVDDLFAEGADAVDVSDIDNAPTIEAEPVRHGSIIETIEDGRMKRVFSCCGTDFTKMTCWMMPNYCPNCGAKLHGGAVNVYD